MLRAAAFDNLKASGSQGGRYLLLADRKILEPAEETNGRLDPIVVLKWGSGRIRRVVRSTLAAEAFAMGEGCESVDHVRFLLAEAFDPEW